MKTKMLVMLACVLSMSSVALAQDARGHEDDAPRARTGAPTATHDDGDHDEAGDAEHAGSGGHDVDTHATDSATAGRAQESQRAEAHARTHGRSSQAHARAHGRSASAPGHEADGPGHSDDAHARAPGQARRHRAPVTPASAPAPAPAPVPPPADH